MISVSALFWVAMVFMVALPCAFALWVWYTFPGNKKCVECGGSFTGEAAFCTDECYHKLMARDYPEEQLEQELNHDHMVREWKEQLVQEAEEEFEQEAFDAFCSSRGMDPFCNGVDGCNWCCYHVVLGDIKLPANTGWIVRVLPSNRRI